MVTQIWPVWDSIMAGAVYHNGRSKFVSTVLAKELGLASRVDSVPPPEQLIAETAGLFPEHTLARHCRSGAWEVVWLAEVADPVPIHALRETELASMPTKTVDLLNLAFAAANASFNSHTKWLVIDDRHGPIETAFEMSELLSYAPSDHSWIPEHWVTTPVEPGFNIGYETVPAADGLATTLRFFTLRLDGFSVYLPRLWFEEQTHRSGLQIELSTGL